MRAQRTRARTLTGAFPGLREPSASQPTSPVQQAGSVPGYRSCRSPQARGLALQEISSPKGGRGSKYLHSFPSFVGTSCSLEVLAVLIADLHCAPPQDQNMVIIDHHKSHGAVSVNILPLDLSGFFCPGQVEGDLQLRRFGVIPLSWKDDNVYWFRPGVCNL